MRLQRKSSRCRFGDCTDCVGAEDGFRLIAVVQLNKGNDWYHGGKISSLCTEHSLQVRCTPQSGQ